MTRRVKFSSSYLHHIALRTAGPPITPQERKSMVDFYPVPRPVALAVRSALVLLRG